MLITVRRWFMFSSVGTILTVSCLDLNLIPALELFLALLGKVWIIPGCSVYRGPDCPLGGQENVLRL